MKSRTLTQMTKPELRREVRRQKGYRKTAEVARARAQARLAIGGQMANLCFNLQYLQVSLEVRQTAIELYRKWDHCT